MIGSARTSSKTLTEAAQDEIRQAILKGTYRPGSQLPGEMELVTMLGVSRTVVREALRMLEEDGLITRRHGVGTFVRKHPILNNLSLDFGTTDMIVSAGMAPGTASFKIGVLPADEEVAEALAVEPGQPVVNIERVRTADGRPVVYSIDCFPVNIAGDIDQVASLADQQESLYHILQVNYGMVIDYGVARILPVLASDHIAGQLSIEPGSLLLYLLQTDYSPSDNPILYSREYHLPDAFDFLILRRGPIRLANVAGPPAAQEDGAGA